MNKIVTVIQARTGSSRFPGKILKPVLGQTLLYRQVERISQSSLKGEVIIATTELPEDRIIEKICKQNSWNCFKGDEFDLLSRHYKAARKWGADAVVKIPSDCPLIDPEIIDKVIAYFEKNNFDYVSNLHPATYPDGNDVEIMSMEALEYSWVMAKRGFEREHTTPFIWENEDQFSIGNVEWEGGLNYSMSHRFTIDYPEDYLLIKTIYEKLYPENPCFSLNDILNLLEAEPDLMQLNSKYQGVNWYRHHLADLTTVGFSDTRILD